MTYPITKSLVIAALLSSGAAYAGTPGWQVSEISGNVTVARKGVVKVAQRQTKLSPGDVIKTGPKGRAVLLRGGEYLVVSPASHIEIAEPAKSGKVTQIIEYLGNVLFRIDKKETPHFGVKTPYMAAVVKGTTFSVSVSADGAAVQVTEGAVEVSTLDDGASELVTPGVIGMINANDPFSLVVIDGERRVIESPNKPAAAGDGNVTTSSKQSHTSQSIAAIAAPSSNLSGVVSVQIGEEGIELAELTNGLIRGDVNNNRYVLVENAEESVGAFEDAGDNIGGEEETISNNSDIGDDQGGEAASEDNKGDGTENGEEGQAGADPGGNTDDADDSQSDNDSDDENSDFGSGPNYGGDQPDGTCNGVPNCRSGDNPDGGDDQGSDTDDVSGSQNDNDSGDENAPEADTIVDIPLINQSDDDQDDGNNGHGNDDDGFDDSNPGNRGGMGKGKSKDD